jgi:23S rRNA pseudouridine1911/1915/1917 synthase
VAERNRPSAFVLEAGDEGATLAAALRRRLAGQTWSEVRALCTTGKVSLDGERALDPAARVHAGQRVELRPNAPKPQTVPAGFRIALEDAHLVIIEKPSGVSSVPYERKETGTALDLIRAAWRRAGKRATATPLYTVHRIDKDTSGLLVFAKTRLAERGLHDVFQRHTAARAYLAVAEGDVVAARIESRLVADRGDGIRGSTRRPVRGAPPTLRSKIDSRARASAGDRRYTLPRATRDRTHPPDPHPPLRARPPAGWRDGLRARAPAGREGAAAGAAPDVARRAARLPAPGHRRARRAARGAL